MNKNVEYLIEPLLKQFFLIDVICGEYLGHEERSKIFRELSEVFCVPFTRETEQCYQIAINYPYNNITDYAAYGRLCRTIEFAQLSGQKVVVTPMESMILAQKREAVKSKDEIFSKNKNLTADMIVETLSSKAMNGNVDAMITFAYMEYHGICTGQDRETAKSSFALCASWNSLAGNLMGIAYDPQNRLTYFETLCTTFKRTKQKEVFRYICKNYKYPEKVTESPIAEIVEKAFGLEIIKKNAFDPLFAKVVFSSLLSIEDKEKILLSKKKDALASLSDIPFDAVRHCVFTFEAACVQIPLKRDEELEQILCGLSPVAKNQCYYYKPLMIAGNDPFVTKMYMQAIEDGFGQDDPVIKVDAGALVLRDFVGGKEHYILRGLSESKRANTVFLLENCEALEDEVLDELIKLLNSGYRQKFKLTEPTVSLDLSDVIIVLFASEVDEKVRKLSEECDAVWTERLSEKEMMTMVDCAFKRCAEAYRAANVVLDDAGQRYLSTFNTDQIAKIIDYALKKALFDGASIIDVDLLKSIVSKQNITHHKREFGYLGGGSREKY